MTKLEILNTAKNRAKQWLSGNYDKDTKQKVHELLNNPDPKNLIDSFYKDLEFGTGGMRGIMGVGTNRINKYTLGAATQGLANYLKKQFKNTNIKVAIGYDCRNNSQHFAKLVANILSANDITAHLFKELRPTPELSFAIRHLGCPAGIVLTASHNPPEYNGYKVFWDDGSQVVSPHDKGIINEVKNVKANDILFTPKEEKIKYINNDLDDIFIEACIKHSQFCDKGKENLKIVFTSIHGTSIKLIPTALEKAGFKKVYVVEEQATPNGNFPTVKSPNPEEPDALKMALDLAEKKDADIVIGTDPDADRLGVAVRDLEGNMRLLNGNQTNTLLTHYLLENLKKQAKLTPKHFICSTVVSSDIFFDLANQYNVGCEAVLTGFKWIGKSIRENEGKRIFVGGGEESFGYMVGDFVRDKDSVASTLLIAEIASVAKANGGSIFQELLKIYSKTGLYQEKLVYLIKKGIEGAKEVENLMINFRENPPTTLLGKKAIKIMDCSLSAIKDLETNSIEHLDLPKSNVLIFYIEDGTKLAIRPSGTEPKIKFYFSVKTNLDSIEEYPQKKAELEAKIDNIVAQLWDLRNLC